MAATIMWLRGYHAGKTGVIPSHSNVPYGGRLGFYCGQHPNARVIDASEQILSSRKAQCEKLRQGRLPMAPGPLNFPEGS